MSELTSPSLTELQAQRAQLDRQIAASTVAPLQAAHALLQQPSTAALADELEPLLAQLPAGDLAHVQISNVITVIRAVPGIIDQELARVSALVGEPE
ncbi:hypothetical protein HHL26_04580 [Sphingobium sp. TB-6]|uniref:hypothetical protein n=1 Tax=Sphingobium sp. TB-6 TaxID=2728850 RepID=UPI00146F6206|nr:hypothetical protein [Sphingobium sp. TB-6]NML88341.1 hypothetical protein [Sphingobium sp. TB-6]